MSLTCKFPGQSSRINLPQKISTAEHLDPGLARDHDTRRDPPTNQVAWLCSKQARGGTLFKQVLARSRLMAGARVVTRTLFGLQCSLLKR